MGYGKRNSERELGEVQRLMRVLLLRALHTLGWHDWLGYRPSYTRDGYSVSRRIVYVCRYCGRTKERER